MVATLPNKAKSRLCHREKQKVKLCQVPVPGVRHLSYCSPLSVSSDSPRRWRRRRPIPPAQGASSHPPRPHASLHLKSSSSPPVLPNFLHQHPLQRTPTHRRTTLSYPSLPNRPSQGPRFLRTIHALSRHRRSSPHIHLRSVLKIRPPLRLLQALGRVC